MIYKFYVISILYGSKKKIEMLLFLTFDDTKNILIN